MSQVPISPELRAAAMAEALREIGRGSRLPFRKVLAELLGAAPKLPSLIAFAQSHPDKWAQAVSLLAGLSGYEKGVIELNVYNVGNMSDVQLLQELHKGEGELHRLGIRAPRVIEQGPQAQAADPVEVAAVPEKSREAPPPVAALRDAAGDYVNPAEAV